MIKIREHEIDIDVFDEIMNYEWTNGTRKSDEYVCCSPFRDEQHPSFSINLETGLWIDFGSSDDYWKQGNLVKLIAFMENFTMEEAENLLLESYGMASDVDGRELIINIQKEEEPKVFTKEELRPYLMRTNRMVNYVYKRGISYEVMKKFVLGYDMQKEAVAFFWLDWKTGKVINVKFRSIKSKVFYYAEGQQIRNHLFGLYQVMQEGHKEVFLVESETDCLYLWSIGVAAVALGGSNFSDEQKRKLLLSGIETLTIATDRDKAGFRIRNQVIRELGSRLILKQLHIPHYANDVNDLSKPELMRCIVESEEYELKIM